MLFRHDSLCLWRVDNWASNKPSIQTATFRVQIWGTDNQKKRPGAPKSLEKLDDDGCSCFLFLLGSRTPLYNVTCFRLISFLFCCFGLQSSARRARGPTVKKTPSPLTVAPDPNLLFYAARLRRFILYGTLEGKTPLTFQTWLSSDSDEGIKVLEFVSSAITGTPWFLSPRRER